MNLGTVGGLGVGIIFIIASCLLAGSVKAFMDFASLVIVGGGCTASVFVAFPVDSIKSTMKFIKELLQNHPLEIKSLVDSFNNYSKAVKKNGKLALEKVEVKDPFLKKGIDYIVGNKPYQDIEIILDHEREALYETEIESQKVLDKFGELAPAWGMIGTLIGLVVMMLKLDDPSAIGPSMAVALITTFYGAVSANLVFIPLAFKAETKVNEKYVLRGIIIEGIVALAKEESPRVIEDKLMAYIHRDRKYRMQMEKEGHIPGVPKK